MDGRRWIARDVEINRLSARGKNFSETDKLILKVKQLEFLKLVLPDLQRSRCSRGKSN